MSDIIMLDQGARIIRTPDAGHHPLSLLKDIYVERGTLDDWKVLHELHYKASNLGIGPRYWRARYHDQTIGIIVMTVPKPLDSGRNQVFPHLCPNKGGRDSTLINKQRMHWLNQNLILCSRQVIDTMYRGAGIAYRFRNLAFRMSGYRFVESRSSMSRFNPFYQKTGMKLVAPKTAPAFESGLAFFAKWFKSPAYDYVALKNELEAMPAYLRDKALAAVRDFYYKNSSMEKSGDNRLNGTSRVETMEIAYLLKQTQQLVFGATVYAVFQNPDWDPTTGKVRPMPQRLPLLAFDNQSPTAALRLDLLADASHQGLLTETW